MKELFCSLQDYREADIYPMHMPGHKRNPVITLSDPYSFDVTEVEGMDDLHHPQGILKEGMMRAAKAFHSQHTFYLVGGSTSGLLVSISACCKREDTILMGRNCHKSVYNAAYLLDLQQEYLYPPCHLDTGIVLGVTAEDVEKAWKKNPKIGCVVITSPTYEGIVSDIEGIAEFLHKKNIPLIVDEAHGAHFVWDQRFPRSAVEQGADLVVQSVHKTLPALTQTGLLHLNSNIVSEEEVKKYFSIYQSSSPSYVLMSSIERCVSFMLGKGTMYYDQYFSMLQGFYDQTKSLKHLQIFKWEGKDPSKIVIDTSHANISGQKVKEFLLEEFRVEMEMATGNYLVAMTSLMDRKEGFERLATGLQALDKQLEKGTVRSLNPMVSLVHNISAYRASYLPEENVALEESIGRMAKKYIYIYPPGIPIVVPGEIINKEVIDIVLGYLKDGLEVQGLERDHTMKVARERMI